MADERVLLEAPFDSAGRYSVWSTGIILTLTVVGIPLLLTFLPIVDALRTIEYKHIRCTRCTSGRCG